MDKPVRLKSIADKLGISLSTVSRVLNDKPGISQKTRDLVLNELKQSKGELAPVVRSLLPVNGKFIGIIGRQRSGQLDSVYFHHSTIAFDETFRQSGYQSLIIPVTDDDMNNPLKIPALQSSSCDAYIIRGQSLSPRFIMEIKSLGKPVVLLENRLYENLTDSIVCDDYNGAKNVTEHLIGKKHKKIAHITGPDYWFNNRERLEGYKSAMTNAGLEPIIIFKDDTTINTGADSLRDLQRSYPDCTAVFTANDAMAIGLLNQARNEGIKIPDQLAIAGFDDIPWATMTYPPLTALHIHIEKMGELAAIRILQLIKDPESPPVEMKMPGHLIIRETT